MVVDELDDAVLLGVARIHRRVVGDVVGGRVVGLRTRVRRVFVGTRRIGVAQRVRARVEDLHAVAAAHAPAGALEILGLDREYGLAGRASRLCCGIGHAFRVPSSINQPSCITAGSNSMNGS